MRSTSISLMIFVLASCNAAESDTTKNYLLPVPASIAEIPVPSGYRRVALDSSSFGYWLRRLPLKKDNLVHLYDGRLKLNQHAQYAVLALSIGDENLQQCADVVMRLRADYLKETGKENQISFNTVSGQQLSFQKWKNGTRYRVVGNRLEPFTIHQPSSVDDYNNYLKFVFTYCSTISLQRDLKKKPDQEVEPGNVFVRAGSPGHAMMVMDVAINNEGKRIFMLAQGYMPAQDIHIVKNPNDGDLGCWYEVNDVIETPEWTFRMGDLFGW